MILCKNWIRMKRFKYLILPIAIEEFREARMWYASKKVKGLSNRFAKSVKASIEKICIHPTAFSIRYKTTRIVHTEKFPYAIHFFIKEDSVIITAIIFNRRDPQITRER